MYINITIADEINVCYYSGTDMELVISEITGDAQNKKDSILIIYLTLFNTLTAT